MLTLLSRVIVKNRKAVAKVSNIVAIDQALNRPYSWVRFVESKLMNVGTPTAYAIKSQYLSGKTR